MCKGKNCAVRIGFYHRKRAIVRFKNYYNIPIARWLCRQKGVLRISHRTFSLLPHMLVPYQSHDVSFMNEAVKAKQAGLNYRKIADIMANYGENDAILIESRQIKSFRNIFKEAYYKLTAFADTAKQILSFRIPDPVDAVMAFIETCSMPDKPNKNISSTMLRQNLETVSPVESLVIAFYYDQQKAFSFFDRLFLFGTPAQKRFRQPGAGFA